MKKHITSAIILGFGLITALSGLSHAAETTKDAAVILTDHGKSDYRIVISSTATKVEKLAAKELQSFLHQIAGVNIEIGTDKEKVSGAEILLGKNAHLDKVGAKIDFASLGREGFSIRTHKNYLVIAGNTDRGTLYGVYSFLEDHLGCRWYSSTASRIPKKKTISLGEINDTQIPVLDYREVYYSDAMDPNFAGRLKLNGNASKINNGKMVIERHAGWTTWSHTLFTFVPPSKYFKKHPEYYSLNKGERKTRQLCLTNPEIVDVAVANIRNLLKNPIDFIPHSTKTLPREGGPIWARGEDIFIGLSQQDGGGRCECENCKKVDTYEGSPSGSILTFVNKVAAHFPDKTVSTLAYFYSVNPPKHIKPAPNVSIMLCNYGSSRTFAFENTPFGHDKAFMQKVEKWSEISNNLMIWDYVVNFSNLYMPNPNLHIQKSNIKFYIKHNAKGIFEQASREGGGEFCELRNYLLAKLLWNPDIDTDVVIDDFLDGYYGAAGKEIRKYIDLMRQTIVDGKISVGIYSYPKPYAKNFLSEDMLKQYNAIFDKADQLVAGDKELMFRVRTARMPLMWVELENGYGSTEKRLKSLSEFLELCTKNKVSKLSETGNTPDKFHQKHIAKLGLEVGVKINPPGGFFGDFKDLHVQLSSPQKNATMRYTIDGSEPTEKSTRYNKPISIRKATIIKAAVFGKSKPMVSTAHFKKVKLPLTTDTMGGSDPAKYLKLPISGVKTLKLIVNNAGDSNANDHADWADAKLIDSKGNATYLSDMKPLRQTQEWGKLGINKSVSGKPLQIGNKKFAKGLGTHAVSEIIYQLDGKYKTFETWIGVDAGTDNRGSVVFKVETTP